MRELFHNRAALLDIAAAYTLLPAEKRTRMADVHREIEALVSSEVAADVSINSIELMEA